MTRREFIELTGSAAAVMSAGGAFGSAEEDSYASSQREIDRVKAATFGDYLRTGKDFGEPALQRLEAAFDKVLAEVKTTTVIGRPAVWFVYNMGVIVKTARCCFSIDLMHRRAADFASFLDFALITHNHGDHYTEDFYRAMNGTGKMVISNFKDNYGVADRVKSGGYTRAEKTFRLGDAEIRTTLTDHNEYLVDFTTTFEIRVGDFTIYHTGDCSNLTKLNPCSKSPDLWIVHPRCGTSVVEGVKKLNPKLTAIVHLNELGHDKWRWNWADGLDEKRRVKDLGRTAIVPVWGERIA